MPSWTTGLLPAELLARVLLTALSLAWGWVWLRLVGVDPTQLFATSATMTAVVPNS